MIGVLSVSHDNSIQIRSPILRPRGGSLFYGHHLYGIQKKAKTDHFLFNMGHVVNGLGCRSFPTALTRISNPIFRTGAPRCPPSGPCRSCIRTRLPSALVAEGEIVGRSGWKLQARSLGFQPGLAIWEVRQLGREQDIHARALASFAADRPSILELAGWLQRTASSFSQSPTQPIVT